MLPLISAEPTLARSKATNQERTKLTMKTMNFDMTEAPKGKDVLDTEQLKPRTGPERFQTSNNTLEASRKDHGSLGALGSRGFSEKAGK